MCVYIYIYIYISYTYIVTVDLIMASISKNVSMKDKRVKIHQRGGCGGNRV